MRIEVHDSPNASQYEVAVDGEPAGVLAYRLENSRITMFHAETDQAYGGRGVASEMARYALEDARARELEVIPSCPFVSGYIRKHSEYADLVPADQRARYGIG
jgi:predicted GNAT family acetyltransferase